MSWKPYAARIATNISGVAVGYAGLAVNSLSGEPSKVDDWALAMSGALLIPVISRLAGISSRAGATPWVLSTIRWSSIVFTIFAGIGFLLAVEFKRKWLPADEFLSAIVPSWYIFVIFGLIFDCFLVAAEEEKNEQQFGSFIRNLF